MLQYSRTKTVGVQKQGNDRRVVSGALEDELYAMQCEIAIDWPTLTIESIQTRMKRFTTLRCVRAEQVFEKAQGWKIDTELDGKIKKELGRYGCRHMAALMIDCCRTLARAELARALRSAREADANVDTNAFLADFWTRYPSLKQYLQLQ